MILNFKKPFPIIKAIRLQSFVIVCILFSIFSLLGTYTLVSAHLVGKSTLQGNTDAIELPIIMYHSILKDPARSGKYILTPTEFENDLQYLQKNGYTTIFMSDLISYVYEDTPLPTKPIIITFDDGHYNNLGYAVPLLKKYNMKAVISIVGSYTDTYTKTNEANLNYSYLRWKDIVSLMESDIIEFQNHTYDMHSNTKGRNGCSKKYGESVSIYQQKLSEDIQKLQKEFFENTNYTPNTFTYPFGAVSKPSLDVIKSLGFKASLSCSSGINQITKDPNCLYLLKRNNRPSFTSLHKILSN